MEARGRTPLPKPTLVLNLRLSPNLQAPTSPGPVRVEPPSGFQQARPWQPSTPPPGRTTNRAFRNAPLLPPAVISSAVRTRLIAALTADSLFYLQPASFPPGAAGAFVELLPAGEGPAGAAETRRNSASFALGVQRDAPRSAESLHEPPELDASEDDGMWIYLDSRSATDIFGNQTVEDGRKLFLYIISALDVPVAIRVSLRPLPSIHNGSSPENSFDEQLLPPMRSISKRLMLQPLRQGTRVPVPLRNGTTCDFEVVDVLCNERGIMEFCDLGLLVENTIVDIVASSYEMPCKPNKADVEEVRRYLRDCYGCAGERLEQMFAASFLSAFSLGTDNVTIDSIGGRAAIVTGPSGIGKSFVIDLLCSTFCVRKFALNAGIVAAQFAGDIFKGFQKYLSLAKRERSVLVIDQAQVFFPRNGEYSAVHHLLLRTLQRNGSAAGRIFFLLVTEERCDISEDIVSAIPDTISLEIPSPTQRLRILRWSSEQYRARCDPKDLQVIAERCHGYMPADVEALCRAAANIATTDGRRKALPKDFARAFAEVRITGLGQEAASPRKPEPVSWSEVGGLQTAKAVLEESTIWVYKFNPAFRRLRIKPSKGVLLYGPPGTGKTLLAKAVTTESSANFLPISIPDLIKGEVGESEKAISRIFNTASRCSPCVIFFDELDALFGSRESSSGYGKKLISQLLVELDQLDANQYQGVVVLAATNFPDVIDPSILRPGRLDRLVYIPPPAVREREAILHILTAAMPLAADMSLAEVAAETEFYTGADLKAVVRCAGLAALKRERMLGGSVKVDISQDDFTNALRSVKSSVSEEVDVRYKSFASRSGSLVRSSSKGTVGNSSMPG